MNAQVYRRGLFRMDAIFPKLCAAFAGLMLILAFLLLFVLVADAWPAIRAFGWQFVTGSDWDAVNESFGAFPNIVGTLYSSLLALLIAVPVSIGIALYLSEFAPEWMREPVSLLIQLLAAVPSVIYGLWGIFVLVPFLREVVQPFLGKYFGFLPFFQGPNYGLGMLAAGVILSIMIIPTISSISREVFQTVPRSLKEGALGLGSTRWEMVQIAMLPPSRSGILGAILLGLGRAIGETMAVTMVIGNTPNISWSLFSPGYTLAAVIANEFSEATTKLYTSALIELGLILLVLTLVLNILARFLIWSVVKGPSKGI